MLHSAYVSLLRRIFDLMSTVSAGACSCVCSSSRERSRVSSGTRAEWTSEVIIVRKLLP